MPDLTVIRNERGGYKIRDGENVLANFFDAAAAAAHHAFTISELLLQDCEACGRAKVSFCDFCLPGDEHEQKNRPRKKTDPAAEAGQGRKGGLPELRQPKDGRGANV